jgi:hypothetical protein
MKSVESLVKDAMRNAVLSCSEQYGFDSADALMRLGVDSVTISVVKGKGTKEKKAGVKKAAIKVPSIALPFTTCNPALCSGLKQNHGLYTQCASAPVEGNSFCKGCIKQCEKNDSGKPDNGTIEDRIKSEFKGPKGDAPKHYTAVMKKLKLTKEQVLEEAGKFGIDIDEEHFVAPATQTKRGRPSKKSADDNSASAESKKRGRPKKAPKDVKSEGEVDDLFANLVSEAQSGEEDASETSSLSGSETSIKSKKTKLTDAEKAEKKLAAEQEKAEKKLMADQEKETKKLALEQAKADKKAAAEKEKADKKAAAEKEKADKKAAADQLKAEKEAKKVEAEKEKADKKAALEAKKTEKESKPVAEKAPKAAKATKKEEVPAAAPAVLKVKKFEYKGTKYLKSSNGVVYNMEQDEVGTWNEESKEIDFKAVDNEEEEEDYESDDE